MKKFEPVILLAVAILTVPWIYLAMIYKSLPTIVPTHFDGSGQPNDYSDKSTLLVGVGVLTGIAFATFLLLRNIKTIDPKKNASVSQSTFNKVAFAMVFFMSGLALVVVQSSAKGSIGVNSLLMPLLGLFFAYLGNLMNSLKPNYFFGIRVPWTLENDENWRKTHQFAGKLWFAAGLVITVCSLLFKSNFSFELFIGIVIFISVIPVIYSFILFKKSQAPIS